MLSGWCGSLRFESISSLLSQVMWYLPRSATCWLHSASWKSKQIYIIWDLMNKGMTPYDLPEMLILSCSLIPQYRSLVFMVYGMLAVFTSMGWAYVTLILSHCVLLYSISLVKLRWLCFVAGLTTLATFKMEPFISWQVCVWHSENVKIV